MKTTADMLRRIPEPPEVKNRISRHLRELRLLRELLKLATLREEHRDIIRQASVNIGGEA